MIKQAKNAHFIARVLGQVPDYSLGDVGMQRVEMGRHVGQSC